MERRDIRVWVASLCDRFSHSHDLQRLRDLIRWNSNDAGITLPSWVVVLRFHTERTSCLLNGAPRLLIM